jgi:hypothetical protein
LKNVKETVNLKALGADNYKPDLKRSRLEGSLLDTGQAPEVVNT